MTLSLDLRGVEASHALSHEARSRGASVSLLVHSAVVSTLVLVPLLQTTRLPEVAAAAAPPLPRAILVTLPPAPLQRTPARRASSANRPTQAAVVPTTPTDTPTTLNVSSNLQFDLAPTMIGDDIGVPDGVAGGTCPLGSVCGTATGPVDPPPAPLVRIGGLIREPRLKESRPPVYPSIAQVARQTGTVVLEARVGTDGRVKEVRVTEGHPLFDESALAHVRTRVYEALLLNGVPTEFLVTITVRFNVR